MRSTDALKKYNKKLTPLAEIYFQSLKLWALPVKDFSSQMWYLSVKDTNSELLLSVDFRLLVPRNQQAQGEGTMQAG